MLVAAAIMAAVVVMVHKAKVSLRHEPPGPAPIAVHKRLAVLLLLLLLLEEPPPLLRGRSRRPR